LFLRYFFTFFSARNFLVPFTELYGKRSSLKVDLSGSFEREDVRNGLKYENIREM
jgi:hypothetical protein